MYDLTCLCVQAQPLTAGAVAVACGAPKSSKSFRRAIIFITLMNVRVDLRHALNASFHFDEEMFDQGKKIITEGLKVVKASNTHENYEAARQKLGEILHPLQVLIINCENFNKAVFNCFKFKGILTPSSFLSM